MVRQMLENRKEANYFEELIDVKRSRCDKDIYFEAIYREDLGGQIFMKYLIAKHKMVKIKCFDLILCGCF